MPPRRCGHNHNHQQQQGVLGKEWRVPHSRKGKRDVFADCGSDGGWKSSEGREEQDDDYYYGGRHHRSSRGRRRDRSRSHRGKRSQWWCGEGQCSDGGFPDPPREDGHHHRRTRQRRESSQPRHRRHRRSSFSSSSSRDSHHHPKQEQGRHYHHMKKRDEENRATHERSRHGDGVKKCQAAVLSPHQQLLSALDQQLAVYRNRSSGDMKMSPTQTAPSASQGKSSNTAFSTSRIVLYGVDFAVQQSHLHSMLEQLVGRRPLNVFRPAAELWQSLCNTAPGSTETSSETPHATVPESCLHLGLHDVCGAGGIVVMELAQTADAAAVVAVMNGACINGRFITAVASS